MKPSGRCHNQRRSGSWGCLESDLRMDSDWLGRLVDRHAAALELFARQWCDTPEDVVQEAFVKLAAQHTPPENSAAWLFRVVRNGALNAAQAARRRRRYETARAESTAWFQAKR